MSISEMRTYYCRRCKQPFSDETRGRGCDSYWCSNRNICEFCSALLGLTRDTYDKKSGSDRSNICSDCKINGIPNWKTYFMKLFGIR